MKVVITMLFMVGIMVIVMSFFSSFFLYFMLKKEGPLAYANPFFYAIAFILLYFLIPSMFVEEFNRYYYWGLTSEEIIYSHVAVVFLSVFFLFWAFAFKNQRLKDEDDFTVGLLIKVVWAFIFIYLLSVLIVKFQSGDLVFSSEYEGVKDTYKIKNIAYLLVTISVMMYYSKRKLWVFLPNLLLAMLDMFEGSRTSALIALFPIVISLAILNKNTYIKYIILVFGIMVFVGIFRNLLVAEQYPVPFYINALGEFRETYILLPNMILEENFVAKGNLESFFKSIFQPFLPGFREQFFEGSILPGPYAASLIGRGYGLGSNIIVESIYYSYYFLIVNVFLFLLFLIASFYLIRKVRLVYSIILISYSLIFIRLMIREGVLINITLIVFILLIYMAPFVLANKHLRLRNFTCSK